MAHVTLPTAHAVSGMLQNLLGRDVSASAGDAGQGAWVGRYVTPDNALAAVGVADMRLLAFAGSTSVRPA